MNEPSPEQGNKGGERVEQVRLNLDNQSGGQKTEKNESPLRPPVEDWLRLRDSLGDQNRDIEAKRASGRKIR